MFVDKPTVTILALIAYLTSSTAAASCARTPDSSDTIVRGRFIRCEDARFHLEASGAYRQHEQDLAKMLARVAPENRARLLERVSDAVLTPDYEARVVVVAVEWRVAIVPWLDGSAGIVEFKDAPRSFPEIARYWWSAPLEACDSIKEASPIDLWVHVACCDRPELAQPVCIVGMNYAEPVSDAVSGALTEVLGER